MSAARQGGHHATLDNALKAVANPVRRSMVMVLLGAPDGVVSNCTVFDAPVSKSTLTQHLRVLDTAGIVETTDHGNRCSVRLRSAELDVEVPGLLNFLLASSPEDSR